MEDGHSFATGDAAGCWTTALRKSNDGDFCEFSLRRDPYHPFCCKCGGARTRPHRAVLCALQRLIVQAGGCADKERHVPELYDWDKPQGSAPPVMRSWMSSPNFLGSCSSSG